MRELHFADQLHDKFVELALRIWRRRKRRFIYYEGQGDSSTKLKKKEITG